MQNGRIYNFSAGPGVIFEDALRTAAADMLNFNGSGMSVMEMSHRSPVYEGIIGETEALFREIMNVPDGYKVLFLQGGATMQFAMVPMNLMKRTGKADYAITGYFSKKAAQEAEKYGAVHVAADPSGESYTRIPAQSELSLSPDASYFHYCMNNTIYGTTWNYIPQASSPLVTDMSSCILSEPVDISKFGLIYAGAQKNMGPAGLCVVIIKDELAGNAFDFTPVMLDYKVQIENASMYNTPPTYGIYMLGLMLKSVQKLGGLSAMRERNVKKAALLYDIIDGSGFYKSGVSKDSRSLMNVTFATGNAELDKKFAKEAEAAGMSNIKGHRAVGGMRASIYNAMPIEGCEALAAFMLEFERKNG